MPRPYGNLDVVRDESTPALQPVNPVKEARKTSKDLQKSPQNLHFCHKKQEREQERKEGGQQKKQAPEQDEAGNLAPGSAGNKKTGAVSRPGFGLILDDIVL
jgi:hypothetical protein